MLKAGVAMAVGMTLLIPTFNAINNSYVQVDNPPPWIPSQLPENIQPPDHLPTPPPDWEPPEDWSPPPGWEDWEPPEDWPGKDQGQPPPGWDQGQCPPPIVKRAEGGTGNLTLSGSLAIEDAVPFDVPEYTAAIVVNLTFRDWVAQEIRGRVDHPPGMTFGDQKTKPGERTSGIGGLAAEPRAVANTVWNWTYDPREHDDQLPQSGRYTLVVEADPPQDGFGRTQAMRGRASYETFLVLPCGGAFQ